jgi:hypothetical protein
MERCCILRVKKSYALKQKGENVFSPCLSLGIIEKKMQELLWGQLLGNENLERKARLLLSFPFPRRGVVLLQTGTNDLRSHLSHLQLCTGPEPALWGWDGRSHICAFYVSLPSFPPFYRCFQSQGQTFGGWAIAQRFPAWVFCPSEMKVCANSFCFWKLLGPRATAPYKLRLSSPTES